MYPTPPRGQIRPKISSMPRQQSEATACLDIYKLVVERKRLKQEMKSLDQRRFQIQKRVDVLDQQIADLDLRIQQLRDEPPTTSDSYLAPRKAAIAPTAAAPADDAPTFETLFLEY